MFFPIALFVVIGAGMVLIGLRKSDSHNRRPTTLVKRQSLHERERERETVA